MLADVMDDQLKSMWFTPFQAEEIDTDLDLVKVDLIELSEKCCSDFDLHSELERSFLSEPSSPGRTKTTKGFKLGKHKHETFITSSGKSEYIEPAKRAHVVPPPMIFFVRESRTRVDHRLCMWMTLLQQKVKKWFLKMEYHHQNGHSKCHRRSPLVVGFQAVEEDGALSTVRTGFSHRLLRKATTVVGKEQEALVGALRILLEEHIMKVVEARAILTGVLFHHYGHLVLQVTARVLETGLLEAVGGLDHPGLVQIAAVEAQEESLLAEAVGEVAMYGLLLDRRLGNTQVNGHFMRKKKKTLKDQFRLSSYI